MCMIVSLILVGSWKLLVDIQQVMPDVAHLSIPLIQYCFQDGPELVWQAFIIISPAHRVMGGGFFDVLRAVGSQWQAALGWSPGEYMV